MFETTKNVELELLGVVYVLDETEHRGYRVWMCWRSGVAVLTGVHDYEFIPNLFMMPVAFKFPQNCAVISPAESLCLDDFPYHATTGQRSLTFILSPMSYKAKLLRADGKTSSFLNRLMFIYLMTSPGKKRMKFYIQDSKLLLYQQPQAGLWWLFVIV